MNADDCPAKDVGPHECHKVWACSHGRRFTRHAPDGRLQSASDGPGRCESCAAKVAEEQAWLADSGLVEEVNEALRRTMRARR